MYGSGLLDGLENQLAPVAMERPQPSFLEKGGLGLRGNQRRNRLAANKGARGDMPRPSVIFPR